jgi:hypothetical protein
LTPGCKLISNRTIYTTSYGSHLYGTSTPSSDLDIVSIIVPKYDDLLLQKTGQFASKHSVVDGLDVTTHALPKIISDICSGNSTALEILFSTSGLQDRQLTSVWSRIYMNRHVLLTKQSASLIGYCKSQSKKYDVRGDKMKAVLDLLVFYNSFIRFYNVTTVGEMYNKYSEQFKMFGNGYVTVINIPQKSGGAIDYLSICGRKIPFTIHHKAIIDSLEHLYTEYGARTKEAANGDGVDWKGMMHSVRIAEQAVEFFTTGDMTFPRPNANYLLAIRNKEINYHEVSLKIDQLLLDVEASAKVSYLQEKPVQEVVDEMLLDIYEEMRYV